MLDAISLGLGVALPHQWLGTVVSGLLVEMASLKLDESDPLCYVENRAGHLSAEYIRYLVLRLSCTAAVLARPLKPWEAARSLFLPPFTISAVTKGSTVKRGK